MALTTNISAPTSSVRRGAYSNEWIDPDYLDDQTFNQLFNQAGNVPLMTDFLDKAQSKIYVANQDMDIYEKQYPEDSLLLAADISTGAAGATINAVVSSTQITNDKHAFRVGKSLFVPAEPLRVSKGLASKINKLMRDEKLRIRFGKASRKRVIELFTWKQISQKTASLYKSIIPKSTS